MGRVYSKGACSTCKRRRKKCDEEKPACRTCIRLHLDCSYDGSGKKQQQQQQQQQQHQKELQQQQQATAAVDETAVVVVSSQPQCRLPEETSPTILVQRLRMTFIANEAEEAVLCRVQHAILSFYTLACSDRTRDLSELMQITFDDVLARNAVVACFSAVLGHTPEYGQLNRKAYGSALRLLRNRIDNSELNERDGIVLRVAANYLGLLDCVGPEWTDDIMRHWRALAKLFVHFKSDIIRTPFPLMMQSLEGFVYNTSCLALFTDDVHGLCMLWQQTQVIQSLEEANPEGPKRIANSPLLCGEYDMYELVLQVTCLHRTAIHERIDPKTIDLLETAIDHVSSVSDRRFTRASLFGVTAQEQQVIVETYRGLSACLRICLIALRPPSDQRREEVDRIVSESLTKLVILQRAPMCFAALMWPLVILACAVRRQRDIDTFEAFVDEFNIYLDPGHRRRLEAVIRTVRKLRKDLVVSVDGHEKRLSSLMPVGLSLLRKPKGILS